MYIRTYNVYTVTGSLEEGRDLNNGKYSHIIANGSNVHTYLNGIIDIFEGALQIACLQTDNSSTL